MAKPDNRNDNVEKLQTMKEQTAHNIEAAEETMANTDLTKAEKRAIQEKNNRRQQSIDSFEAEIADEMSDRKNGYK
ncbi:small acid-soluble spore protein Tlp [Halalkalibacter urbisdiaboli]|uniref:small acid-soluble spore protein Tlp n=1 Tax=Halalkalibacter urbisdiaboli TaxID=1960589 RepID=UPI000B44652C|nr:small acid-soluble spore protein Tlp [Halalkalibacter urbisdiaboli]